MRTRAQPKPESLQPVWPMWLALPLPGLAVSVVSVRAKQSQFARWGRAALPRPSTPGPHPRQADCAKQSQIWVGWGIWVDGVSGEVNYAKQSQFGGDPTGLRGPNVKNKANSGRSPVGREVQGKCAEQAQSARLCRAGRGPRGVGRGADCAKQSQCAPGRPEGALREDRRCGGRQGHVCETKPIARSGAPRRCPARAGARDPESTPVCRPHPFSGQPLIIA
jgi:hypothetical protein